MAAKTSRPSPFANLEFILGACLTTVICLAVVFSDVLFPGGADKIDLMARLTKPFVSAAHPLGTDPLGRDALPFSHVATIDVGYARVRAARMSYVGGPGYELYVPVEQCATLYDALAEAGPRFGLTDAGYYAIDALRIEAGRRAWGAELSPDETPWEAGLE